MAAYLKDGELILYGVVGADWFWEDGFDADDVIYALAAHGSENDLTVRINSPGGVASQGVAIHSALKAHAGKVSVVVDGEALSAASVIAMAGDERIMRAGSTMMIHDARGDFYGMAEDDTTKAAAQLRAVSDGMAAIYAAVTDGDRDAIRAEMKKELWMTPEDAIERGFATSMNDAAADDPPPYSYDQDYKNPPERLVALSRQNNWRRPSTASARSATQSVAQPAAKENPVADKKTDNGTEPKAVDETQIRADAVSAERERISTINAHAAAGRFPKVVARMIASGVSADDAKEQLDAMAEDVPETPVEDTKQHADPTAYANSRMTAAGAPTPAPKAKASLNTNDIYAARRARS